MTYVPCVSTPVYCIVKNCNGKMLIEKSPCFIIKQDLQVMELLFEPSTRHLPPVSVGCAKNRQKSLTSNTSKMTNILPFMSKSLYI